MFSSDLLEHLSAQSSFCFDATRCEVADKTLLQAGVRSREIDHGDTLRTLLRFRSANALALGDCSGSKKSAMGRDEAGRTGFLRRQFAESGAVTIGIQEATGAKATTYTMPNFRRFVPKSVYGQHRHVDFWVARHAHAGCTGDEKFFFEEAHFAIIADRPQLMTVRWAVAENSCFFFFVIPCADAGIQAVRARFVLEVVVRSGTSSVQSTFHSVILHGVMPMPLSGCRRRRPLEMRSLSPNAATGKPFAASWKGPDFLLPTL